MKELSLREVCEEEAVTLPKKKKEIVVILEILMVYMSL